MKWWFMWLTIISCILLQNRCKLRRDSCITPDFGTNLEIQIIVNERMTSNFCPLFSRRTMSRVSLWTFPLSQEHDDTRSLKCHSDMPSRVACLSKPCCKHADNHDKINELATEFFLPGSYLSRVWVCCANRISFPDLSPCKGASKMGSQKCHQFRLCFFLVWNLQYNRMANDPTLEEKFQGCLVGGLLGDCLGAPFEEDFTGSNFPDQQTFFQNLLKHAVVPGPSAGRNFRPSKGTLSPGSGMDVVNCYLGADGLCSLFCCT